MIRSATLFRNLLIPFFVLFFNLIVFGQDCPESNVTKNGQCMILNYASAQDANLAVMGGESIVVTNSTSGANGTWTVNSICPGTTTEVLFALNGANCNCSGNYNIGEDGDFAFQNAGINCTFLPGGALPVQFGKFIADNFGDNNILLSWGTLTEIDNQGFEIQRSIDGRKFTQIGYVAGNGTTAKSKNYAFLDRSPANGINYYRLKQLDYNGQFEYSKVIAIDHSSSRESIFVLNDLNYQLVSIKTSSPIERYSIFNISGQNIKSEVLSLDQNSYEFDSHFLLSGIYILSVELKNGANKATKLVIP